MDQKCVIWVFWDRILKKTIVMFEINTLKFLYFQNVKKKYKWLKFELTVPYLVISWLDLSKYIVISQIITLKYAYL